MNEEKNREIYERYLNTTHLLGRISCVIALVLLLDTQVYTKDDTG